MSILRPSALKPKYLVLELLWNTINE